MNNYHNCQETHIIKFGTHHACWLVTLLLTLLTASCGGGDSMSIGVTQTVDSTSIVIGEQAHMAIEVTANKGDKVVLPAYKQGDFYTPGVEIVEVKRDTAELSKSKITTTTTLTLTSFDENKYTLPACTLTINGEKHIGEPHKLEVYTVEADTLHPEQFYPEKDIQHLTFQWSEWQPVMWLSVLILLLVLMGCWLYRRLKQNKPIVKTIRIVKHTPPHQKALEEIEMIKSEQKQTSEDQKAYYTKLTEIIRQYIHERFGFNAMEMTSSQIIDKLNQADNGDMLNELRQLFNTADLVKFAKYSTIDNENDRNLLNAITFIDKTKLTEQPAEERKESQLTAEDIKSNNDRKVIKITITLLAVTTFALLCYTLWYASTLIEW